MGQGLGLGFLRHGRFRRCHKPVAAGPVPADHQHRKERSEFSPQHVGCVSAGLRPGVIRAVPTKQRPRMDNSCQRWVSTQRHATRRDTSPPRNPGGSRRQTPLYPNLSPGSFLRQDKLREKELADRCSSPLPHQNGARGLGIGVARKVLGIVCNEWMCHSPPSIPP